MTLQMKMKDGRTFEGALVKLWGERMVGIFEAPADWIAKDPVASLTEVGKMSPLFP